MNLAKKIKRREEMEWQNLLGPEGFVGPKWKELNQVEKDRYGELASKLSWICEDYSCCISIKYDSLFNLIHREFSEFIVDANLKMANVVSFLLTAWWIKYSRKKRLIA